MCWLTCRRVCGGGVAARVLRSPGSRVLSVAAVAVPRGVGMGSGGGLGELGLPVDRGVLIVVGSREAAYRRESQSQ